MAQIVDCLKSRVRNISGERKTFSFLPPHGRVLDADENIDYIGDITQAITRGKESAANRYLQAFADAVAAGDLEVVKNPNPILYDDALNTPSMVRIELGVVRSDTPCWDSLDS